jgi:hypothetical protein
MRKFYPSFKTIFLLAALSCAGFQSLNAQNCGPISENFDLAGGTNGGFTSNTQGDPNSPGFTFAFEGTNAYLQRCGTTAGTVYQVISPTYQSNPDDNRIGVGFKLSGEARASNIDFFIEYFNSLTGMVSTAFLTTANFNYTGPQGNQTATICESVLINDIPGFAPGDNYRIYSLIRAAGNSAANECIIFDDFRTTGIFTNLSLNQAETCGPIQENFDNTGGTMADFTSFTQSLPDPGFTYGSTQQDGYLQRCNVTAGTVYAIHSPTYQTAVSQTFIGYGFELTGGVIVTEATIFLEYTDPNGIIKTAYIGTHIPLYTGSGNNRVARICDSVLISNVTDFTPGGKYRIYVLLSSSTSSQNNQCIEFDNFRTTGFISLIPLPVNFTQFIGKTVNQNVSLFWSVAGEKDVLRYVVERSKNGVDFAKVGEVPASGISTYTFNDPNLSNGVYFYRIKNEDADGQFKFSSILRMNLGKVITIKAFPQPAFGNMTIEHSAVTQKGQIMIMNTNGQIVRQIEVKPETTQTNINLSGINGGVYILRFDNGNGNMETIKIVKQ